MNKQKYKWDPKLYQESSKFQFNLALMGMEKLDFKGNERVLDIGCGNALVTIKLAEIVPKGSVVGIELSEEMYKKALMNLKENNIQNVEIKNINILDVDYVNEFDVVFSNSAIHWIKDQGLLYKLIYRSLKKNGRIMLQTGLDKKNDLLVSLSELEKTEIVKNYIKDFTQPWFYLTKERTEEILKNNSYKNILVEPYLYKVQFNNEDEVINFFKAAALVPYLSKLPENRHKGLVEKFKEIYFKIIKDNKLEVKMTRVFVSAVK